jgi:hypothetical protein
MKCTEEIMTETVRLELVAGLNGNINGGFAFDIEKIVICLIKSYGLEGKTKSGKVEIWITIDSFKPTDKDFMCPIAEQSMFL